LLDFITIGGATRDIFFKVTEAKKKSGRRVLEADQMVLPYGGKLIAEESYYTYGGGSANAAVCLSRLGARVGAMCNIGSEGTGSLLMNALKKERVNTDLITRDDKHHTGLSIFIVGADNEHTGLLERGANSYLSFSRNKIKRARWFYVSSLTGEAAKILPRIFDYAAKNGIKIAFNPGSEQLEAGLNELGKYISQSEILILNTEEAETLVKTKKKYKNKRALLNAVGQLGAKITLVTDGECGSHALFEGKVYSQAAIPTQVVDTTGAGDSFGSTFSFSIARGHDIRYSLKIASINSASVVSFMGAQQGLMTHNEIKESSWL
jgi:sugar/nucleoside kinase (ribokinase family)